ncbi:MAG: hypothetical protein Q9201_002107 [Fulgogasparrea decipioides]
MPVSYGASKAILLIEPVGQPLRLPYEASYPSYKDTTPLGSLKIAPRVSKMHSYIQLLSTPTADTAGTAMILDVGQKRYMFGNIHEGLQRICIQRGSRLAKTTQIFVTGKTEWKNLGGLFGIILTIADATTGALQSAAESAKAKNVSEISKATAAKSEKSIKQDAEKAKIFSDAGLNPEDYIASPKNHGEPQVTRPTLTIHGGRNLTHTIATGRRFIFRKGMPIDVDEHVETESHTFTDDGRDPDWADDSIQVWKLPIEPSEEQYTAEISPSPPRKRAFDEFAGVDRPSRRNEEASISHSLTAEGVVCNDDELRKHVVSEMFNSQWRLDALIESPLKDVTMPALTWIRDPTTNKLERYYPPKEGPIPDIVVLVRQPWPGALVEKLPPTKPSVAAMSYIVRHYSQRGKFLPEKAKALNVHQLIFQALQNGATVKSQDGITVTPEMVLEPTRFGGGFAVVDLPSVSYVHNLLNRPEWTTPRIMDGLQAIIWNLGPGVAGDPALRAFIQQHDKLRHIVAAPDISPNYIALDSTAALVIRLNQIDSQRYPIPIHSNIAPLLSPCKGASKQESPGYIEAVRDYQLQLEPRLQVQEPPTKQPFLDTRRVLELAPKEVLQLAQDARSDIASRRLTDEPAGHNLPSQDAEIICLGTGSSAPSRYRNVSGTLLRVPGCGTYLFDCGEGTLGQLRRLYTPVALRAVLRDLKMIWISHMHADHHLGTASVIKTWYEANDGPANQSPDLDPVREEPIDLVKFLQQDRKLFVFGGIHIGRWLEEYSSVEDIGYSRLVCITTKPDKSPYSQDYSYIEWRGAQVGFQTRDESINEAMKRATGLANLATCYVDHCLGAQAISVKFPTGFKFSYSGDCRPSSRFVQMGRGSTVLVHEATFDDQMQNDAEAKKHSTMSEAVGVAQAMGAKRLILTHFSQRYQKIPDLSALDKIEVRFDDAEISSNEAEAVDVLDDPELMGIVTGSDQQTAEHQAVTPPRTKTGASVRSTPNTSHPSPASRNYDLKIAIAFDFLRVRVGDIADLEKFMPSLQRLFQISEAEEKAKAYDRPSAAAQRKKEEEKEKRKELRENQIGERREAKEQKGRKKRERRENFQPADNEVGGERSVGQSKAAGVDNRKPSSRRRWLDANGKEERMRMSEFCGGEEVTLGHTPSPEADPTAP